MTQPTETATAAYRAAYAGAAVAEEHSAGRILMRGRDRAALLHRLSTNEIVRLRPGQGTRTVLTTPIGRIIDVLAVHALDDALLLVTSPGQGGAVWAHLKQNIFFQDQVVLEAAGRSYGQLALYGPGAAAALHQALGAGWPDLPLHHTATLAFGGAQLIIAARPPIGGPSFTLYVPAAQAEALHLALAQAGTAPLDLATLEVLRVEQGYPAFGRELSQEYIPLETGLYDAVSFTKGCYVGQEIIARMESRGRLAKRLIGLRLSAPAAAPGTLEVAGKAAGHLTSALVSPRLGPIGLAYVRSAQAVVGARVDIAGSDAWATLAELPFEGADELEG
ncbi:MAG: aminomethyl transferase family protein [Kouleothrix sp.]|jgi:aminomethyltransferase|nr:aminomethyl transferase family protein [Kouleothrix sp.]